MDFFSISAKLPRREEQPVEIFPNFIVGRSKDLMVRGKSFYAIWDETKGLWSTDEYDVQRLVDDEVQKYAKEKYEDKGVPCDVKLLRSYDSGRWDKFQKFLKNVSDNSTPLDMKLTFANTEVKKADHVSRRLPYNLGPGDISAWNTLVGTLYSEEEREKIEWAIGAVVSGDSKKIEKFLVFYGPGGTGKSTIMKIIQKLFAGYIAMFEAKALVGGNNAFATAAFKTNPLVAIQHDGDLSKVDDNSTLNSIVGHDDMLINEKNKPQYEMRINAFLFMGTNKPVKITDAKSGLIRRLIDVNPTGVKFEPETYYALMDRIDFELGAIAHHCLQVYKNLGRSHYNKYEPRNMMLKTNPFFNYIEDHFDLFKQQDSVSLKQAWELYSVWADSSKLGYSLKKYQFREELRNYFEEFVDRSVVDGVLTRSVYKGFKAQPFREPTDDNAEAPKFTLVLEETESILDEMYAGYPAQYSNRGGNPKLYWDDSVRINKKGEEFTPEPESVCNTVLGDLDTSKLHFVKLPEYHIWIDFDLTDEDGNKSLEKSIEAAATLFPPTYAEISKSGNGVHLHYIYDGDTSELASEYAPGIEIKVCRGNASLRRKLTMCNNVAVATISGGLPFKEKKVLNTGTLRSEKGLRDMIMRNLNREIHPGHKPSIDFIEHLLKEARKEGYPYDVTDLRQKILAFAASSTNQAQHCLKAVARMDFKSEVSPEEMPPQESDVEPVDDRIVYFDCEVYPNFFGVAWKYKGSPNVVRMIEPTPTEVEQLLKLKLVGYNNRGYDNHILWARLLGASTQELYNLSQGIISNKDGAKDVRYASAWNASYADVYDYSSEKKSLKKWEIELGLKHMEMDIPWDQPVNKEDISRIMDYCVNDVIALEAVAEHCEQDFVARQILANMSGLTVNHSTRQHIMRILFGNERKPQGQFVYTDLSEMFPGYEFNEFSKTDKSTYKGEVVGEGGYVYAEPGIHKNVALLDVASMHPTSIEELNLFGPYTENFSKIKNARLAIKNAMSSWAKADKTKGGEREGHLNQAFEFHREAVNLLPGVHVTKENAKALSDALKLVINSTYGYTSAKFENPARDPRNKDNIVAKRGALFMIDLKNAVQEQGFTVAHIKTDSIKIPDATPGIIQFVMEFGAKYGYTFEHEATYSKMCLVNDAVYVASRRTGDPTDPDEWTATGAEFKHPYVFKTLFTDEAIDFRDLCETKQVKEGAMYLRFGDVDMRVDGDRETDALKNELGESDPGYGDHHIGRSGLFIPVKPGNYEGLIGGELLRIKDGKEYAVSGTKGYRWVEAEMIRQLKGDSIDRMTFERLEDAVEGTGSIADFIDMLYFYGLAESAYQSIAEFGNAEEFCK